MGGRTGVMRGKLELAEGSDGEERGASLKLQMGERAEGMKIKLEVADA
jgi:hypothetical protein